MVDLLCSFMMHGRDGLMETGMPSISLKIEPSVAINVVTAKLRDHITRYLDEEDFVVEGFYRRERGKGRNDSYKARRNKLEGHGRIGKDSSQLFAVCKIKHPNTEATRWSPPVGTGRSSTDDTIEIPLLRDGYPHESREQQEVCDYPYVEGRFVKFKNCGGGLTAFRFTGALRREEVAGISYAWGTLKHKPRLRTIVFDINKKGDVGKGNKDSRSTQYLNLGAEWDVYQLQDKLVDLSVAHWLWMDQLCLQKDVDLSNELSSKISRIYANCQVHALIATWSCDAFQELQKACRRSAKNLELVETHTKQCDCSLNWQIYFGRIWPWHELALASMVKFHLALGDPNVDTGYNRLHTFDKACNQVGVKLAHRFYAMRDRAAQDASMNAAALVLLGWSLECPRRHKIVVRESYDFLTHICKAGREASMKIDFMFAMIPLMGMDITLELRGTQKEEQLGPGLEQLERAVFGATPGVTREPFARAWLESKHLGTTVTDTNDLLPHVRSSSLMEGTHGHTLNTYQMYGDAKMCHVEKLYDVHCDELVDLRDIFEWLSPEQRGELQAFARVERHGGCDHSVTTAICAYLDAHTQSNSPSEHVDSASALTTLSVALGYIAPIDAENFKRKGSKTFGLVGVAYGIVGSGREARALAIQIVDKRSSELCFSYNASLVGKREGKIFYVYGQVLGSRVHHSIRTWCTQHTLDTILNKKRGQYKIKMPDAELDHRP